MDTGAIKSERSGNNKRTMQLILALALICALVIALLLFNGKIGVGTAAFASFFAGMAFAGFLLRRGII